MTSWLGKLLGGGPSAKHLAMVVREERPKWVEIEGIERFDVLPHLYGHEGLPIPDWKALGQWADSLPESMQEAAWQQCIRAWLLHMRSTDPGRYAGMTLSFFRMTKC